MCALIWHLDEWEENDKFESLIWHQTMTKNELLALKTCKLSSRLKYVYHNTNS